MCRERLTQRDEEQQSELDGMQSKLAETRAVMDRYFRAFEAGTMPENTCAPRIAALAEEAKALEGRASELATLQDNTEQPERTTPGDLDALRSTLRAALKGQHPHPHQERASNHDRRNPRRRTRPHRTDLPCASGSH
jgi:site-specific DNA recombinase